MQTINDTTINELVVVLGLVAALSVAFAKAFGPYQMDITQAIIDAAQVTSRYRRLLNLVVGVAIALAFTIVGALWLDSWTIVPAGVLAGILASVEAAKAHDAEAAREAKSARQDAMPWVRGAEGRRPTMGPTNRKM